MSAGGGAVVIGRAPGDMLPVTISRPHLVFAPGERFECRLTPRLPADFTRAGDVRYLWQLSRARGCAPIAEGELNPGGASDDALTLGMELPATEGAYDLDLRATSSSGPVQSRKVQVLVLAATPSADEPPAAAKAGPVLAQPFPPENAGFLRRVGAVRFWKSANRQNAPQWPWPGFSAADWPSVDPEGFEYRAYRLKLENPDQPHRLTLTVPATTSQSLGMGILQPNAAGELVPPGPAAGFEVDIVRSRAETPLHLDFWPTVRDPIVVVHNQRSGRPLQIMRLESTLTTQPERARTEPPAPADQRWIGPYIRTPFLPETFGAAQAADPESGASLDDWETFRTAGERLTAGLHAAGYNSCLLSVLGDGGTLYPSELSEGSCRYDSGPLFTTGQDPVRKDVLEMLFRQFALEQLVLVPELRFVQPLPALENLLSEGVDMARGIELIGHDGRSWSDTHPQDRAPHYNPLDPRVQEAVAAVVTEFVERYRGNPAFRALGLELSRHGCLQLPGLEWGYDDETIARFAREMQMEILGGSGPARFQRRFELLTTKYGRDWVAWRCRELAQFHLRLVRLVTGANPAAKVVFTTTELLPSVAADEDAAAAQKGGMGFDPLLLAAGVDLKLYADARQVLFLRPGLTRTGVGTPGRALEESFNRNPLVDAAFREAGPTAGCLWFDQAQPFRLDDLEALSPWQPAVAGMLTPPVSSPLGERRRWAQAISGLEAQVIFSGGGLSPGAADATRDFRAVLRELPAVPFHGPARRQQPAVVRTAHYQDQTYAYVLNESPDSLPVVLHFNCPATTRLEVLGNASSVRLVRDSETGSRVSLTVPAYGLWACRLHAPQAQLLLPEINVAPAALTRIHHRIAEFEAQLRAWNAAGERLGLPLANPGFELARGPRQELVGWEPEAESMLACTLDSVQPHSGLTAARLVSTGRPVALNTAPLTLGEGRFLTMSLWLRSNREAAQVRLTLEGDDGSDRHEQSAQLDVGPDWHRYVFRVSNLPVDTLRNAHVKIELSNAGKLWIDDVELQLQRLTADDSRQLTKHLSAVRLAWDERRLTDCERLLDGYWGRYLFQEAPPTPIVEETRPQLGNRLRALLRR